MFQQEFYLQHMDLVRTKLSQDSRILLIGQWQLGQMSAGKNVQ